MFSISGWDELSIKYQRHCIHIVNTIHRRSSVENIHIEPSMDKMFRAFELCSYDSVKLVILGQDPYTSMATGIAFSYHTMTPSLQVIKSWLEIDNMNPCLESWAKQGVLLINASMTTEVIKNPISHKILWECFIRGCLEICSKKDIAYLLLGKTAFSYSTSISKGLILKENHPAYYSRNNVYESKKWLFTDINKYLEDRGIEPINFNSVSL